LHERGRKKPRDRGGFNRKKAITRNAFFRERHVGEKKGGGGPTSPKSSRINTNAGSLGGCAETEQGRGDNTRILKQFMRKKTPMYVDEKQSNNFLKRGGKLPDDATEPAGRGTPIVWISTKVRVSIEKRGTKSSCRGNIIYAFSGGPWGKGKGSAGNYEEGIGTFN